MRPRPVCKMSWCDVELPPGQTYCSGHIYLNDVEKRKTEKFAQDSKKLLAQVKAKEAGHARKHS